MSTKQGCLLSLMFWGAAGFVYCGVKFLGWVLNP